MAVQGSASDGRIHLRFDDDVCQGVIACGDHRRVFVYAELEGATLNGLTGVEFGLRIGEDSSPDPGWEFSETFAPGATVALGTGAFNPPDHHLIEPRVNRKRGVNVAWGTCQQGERGLVLLETVEIVNTGCESGPLRITVIDHDTPGNQFFRCPLATLCDGPFFTKVCLGDDVTPCVNLEAPRGPQAQCSTSGTVLINPPANVSNPCRPSAVRATTWTGVKGLYR
jgi:hypothetical protein